MEKFETYIEKHQNMSKLPGPVKEKYLHDFEDRDAYLQNFKGTIEKFFTSKKGYTQIVQVFVPEVINQDIVAEVKFLF